MIISTKFTLMYQHWYVTGFCKSIELLRAGGRSGRVEPVRRLWVPRDPPVCSLTCIPVLIIAPKGTQPFLPGS